MDDGPETLAPLRSSQWLGDARRCLPVHDGTSGDPEEVYPVALGSQRARELFDLQVRSSLEIAKLVDPYWSRWTDLTSRFPVDAPFLELQRMRKGKPASPAALNDALLHLAGFPLLGLLGPVDAKNEADFPPLRPWHPDPPEGWLTHYFGVNEVSTPTWKEEARIQGFVVLWRGWPLEIEVDARYPNAVTDIGIDMLREDRKRAMPVELPHWKNVGPGHATPWGGPRGLRAAFWAFRQFKANPKKSIEAVAIDYIALLRQWGILKAFARGGDVRAKKKRRRDDLPTSLHEAKLDVKALREVAAARVRGTERALELDPSWGGRWEKLMSACPRRR